MKQYMWHNFPNIGFVSHQFEQQELSEVTKEINKISDNWEGLKANKNLAGNIQKQYQLKDSCDRLEKLIVPLLHSYDKEYNYTTEKGEFRLEASWVNFQKKGEYNPIHKHKGIFSFVIWLKIPYLIQEEDRLCDSNTKTSGRFCFVYTDSLGSIKEYRINLTKRHENSIVIFPSVMNHIVYPFYTSEDYRVSVAGNFNLLG